MEGKDVGTYEQSKIVNESSNTANESVSMGAGQKKVEEITSEVSQKPPSSSLTYKAPMTASIKVVFFASIGIAVGLFLLTIEADSQNQFPAFIWAYTAWKTYKQDFAALVTAQKVLAGIAALAVIWGAVTVGDAKSELILGLSPSDMILGGLISFIAHFWLLNFFKGQLTGEVTPEITTQRTPAKKLPLLQRPLIGTLITIVFWSVLVTLAWNIF